MAANAAKERPITVTVERNLESLGTTVKVVLEPLGNRQVRILEYYRRRRNDSRFSRVRGEEGGAVAFRLLGLEQSYEELFPQPALIGDAAD